MSEEIIYSFKINSIDNELINFSVYKNMPLLITNFASKCGLCERSLTQFKKLKIEFPDLKILLFPSNNFKQEYTDTNKIKERIETFSKDFEIFEITIISGDEINPLFKFLIENSDYFVTKKIKWNFTKFLINREGKLVKRIGPLGSVKEEDIKEIY